MSFISALWHEAFLQQAVLAGLLASLSCGVIGSYVVVKRIAYLAGGIAHSLLGGMGIAYFLGASPLLGAFVGAILCALLIGWVNLHWREQEDTLISALWAVGMAVGIIFAAKTPGYAVDLFSYLFGNILLVSAEDLIWLASLDVLLLLVVWQLRRAFLVVCFDEEFARLRGLPVTRLYLLLLVLVAVTIVMLIQIVGLILVIALLTLPAAIAGQFTRQLSSMMLLATILGMGFTSGGLALSYQPDLPAGASIILLAGASYLVTTIWTARKGKA